MTQNLKDLGSLIQDLATPYFAFKKPVVDTHGRPMNGLCGKLKEEGKDYISIIYGNGEPVLVPREQIAYISNKPLSSDYKNLPSELLEILTTTEEIIFTQLFQKGRSSKQELMDAGKITYDCLKWTIFNLRKKLQETPYEINTIRGRGYSLKVNPKPK